MSDQLFDALIQLLNVHQQRHSNGYIMILLLTILLNYRKYEVFLAFIDSFQKIVSLVIQPLHHEIVDCRRRDPTECKSFELNYPMPERLCFKGYAQVISNELLDFNKKFDQVNNETKASGLFNALSNMVSS